jgi:hypothetical protein
MKANGKICPPAARARSDAKNRYLLRFVTGESGHRSRRDLSGGRFGSGFGHVVGDPETAAREAGWSIR